MVYKLSKEEQALAEIQKPVLEKLSASGFGVNFIVVLIIYQHLQNHFKVGKKFKRKDSIYEKDFSDI